MKLSAVVITYNEEKNLERCLKSLQFCDDIVVVDSQSTDSTLQIAKKYAHTVVTQPWMGYAKQKNFAVSLAKNKWILNIDADEEVPVELQQEICLLLENKIEPSGFWVARKTFHSGRWIRYGGWYPNYLVRLFDRSCGFWKGTNLHERWESTGALAKLKHPLYHYSFKSISDQVSRNNAYSSLGVKELLDQGKKFSCFKLCGKPFLKFMETYFLKLGFLDGYPGFIISISAAYSVFLKWAKLWELERNE